MNGLTFIKMHGLGNDFVVIDGRQTSILLNPEQTRAISDRRTGVGCDQLIVLEPPKDGHADAFMRILNADGGEAEACGNATRCIAQMIMDETGNKHTIIETVAGLLDAEAGTDGMITVDMGLAHLDWRDIPLGQAIDTLHLGIGSGPLQDPVAVNVGNPHAVFFVDDAGGIDLETHGPVIERHALFPQRTNVEAAEIVSETEIRLRVWERGVGETRACGSGACATMVAAHRRGLIGRKAAVFLNGGTLHLEWMPDGHVSMTGPTAVSYAGTLDLSLLV
ncbi:MAG: diaminopimelate epimerase [Rhodospirillaceae bacterium]|nr:diaminopimelate epimerase [Rhodospirillaceae bacterium]